jgi:hypothetical protein
MALLWTRRSNLAVTASNILQKGLKSEVSEVAKSNIQMQTSILSQNEQIKELTAHVKLLNDNLYVLSQAANIGIENKQLIAKNYLASNDNAPIVEAAKVVAETGVKNLLDEAKEIAKKSTIDELLKKV